MSKIKRWLSQSLNQSVTRSPIELSVTQNEKKYKKNPWEKNAKSTHGPRELFSFPQKVGFRAKCIFWNLVFRVFRFFRYMALHSAVWIGGLRCQVTHAVAVKKAKAITNCSDPPPHLVRHLTPGDLCAKQADRQAMRIVPAQSPLASTPFLVNTVYASPWFFAPFHGHWLPQYRLSCIDIVTDCNRVVATLSDRFDFVRETLWVEWKLKSGAATYKL